MTVRETVRTCLMTVPTIYKNALDVYNQLFCVIGNGYEWKDGELVYVTEKRVPLTIQEAVINFLNKELVDDSYMLEHYIKGGIQKKFFERMIEDVQIIMSVDALENSFELLPSLGSPFAFYPLCKYSYMCCIPDDIKPDWLEAIVKLIDIMENNKNILSESDIKWIDKAKERIKEIKSK